jgi:sulfide:quinone oxidoreductase
MKTMQIRKIDSNFSVSEQIRPADAPAIAAAGFRSIICNRPDGEGWGQPSFAEIEAAAKAAGLEAAYLPVTPGGMTPRDVNRFAELLRTLPGPVFGYCRSGARSSGMWQAAQALRMAG